MRRQDASQNVGLPSEESQYLKNYKASLNRWVAILNKNHRSHIEDAPATLFKRPEKENQDQQDLYAEQGA